MTKTWLLSFLLVLAPAWWACGTPPSTAAEAAQPPEPDETTPVPSPEPGEPQPVDPPELAEPTLVAEPGLPTPDPRAPCCFTHPRYAGSCVVTPAGDETCASILAYLNDQNSTGKTYCQSTDLRGGWKPVQCLEE